MLSRVLTPRAENPGGKCSAVKEPLGGEAPTGKRETKGCTVKRPVPATRGGPAPHGGCAIAHPLQRGAKRTIAHPLQRGAKRTN